MTTTGIQPTALPFSAPADPGLTGGRRIGVLLSHGFTGSPASMRPWGEHLAALGHAVEVPRLPGHGTRWQEMNRTGWADWYGEVERAFEKLVEENDTVVVGGLSMGGSLVLRLAADHPDRVAGVVLVNPGLNMERKDLAVVPLLKWVLPAFPGIGNDIKKPDTSEGGYDWTPLKALDEMLHGWKVLRGDLGKVTAPVLYLHSDEDHVVDPSSARIIREQVSSTDFTRVELHDSYHVATLDNDAPLIFDTSVEFIRRVTATG